MHKKSVKYGFLKHFYKFKQKNSTRATLPSYSAFWAWVEFYEYYINLNIKIKLLTIDL